MYSNKQENSFLVISGQYTIYFIDFQIFTLYTYSITLYKDESFRETVKNWFLPWDTFCCTCMINIYEYEVLRRKISCKYSKMTNCLHQGSFSNKPDSSGELKMQHAGESNASNCFHSEVQYCELSTEPIVNFLLIHGTYPHCR